MEQYIRDGVIRTRNNIVIQKNGMQYFNPTEEMLRKEGWERYMPAFAETISEEIEQAKSELQEGDYKIIKCIEAYLCGEELPYDIQALHSERNAYRALINQSENNN